MEKESPATAAEGTVCYTHIGSPDFVCQYQQLYARLKNKLSLLVLLGCVPLVALSYIAVSLTAPMLSSSSLSLSVNDAPLLSPNTSDLLRAPAPLLSPNASDLLHAHLLSPNTSDLLRAPLLSPNTSNLLGISPGDDDEADPAQYKMRLKEVFERAAMPNRTVIITALNAAWAEEGTMIDLFLESFSHGDDTFHLLRHLVIVCVDDRAYQRCLAIHPHCTYIKTPGINFAGAQLLLSPDYIKLMWRRIKFLHTVLEMDYSFIFTDTDVLWFRNPLPLLHRDTEADFQIACDRYNGRPWDVRNAPNTGFVYVRANARTLRFYEYWYEERRRDSNMADQGMLNVIKFDKEFTSIGMKLRFLDTQFFGGFCGLRYTDMTKALTMHATCCKGQEAKLLDLRMMLDGWTKWHAQNLTMSTIAQDQHSAALTRSSNSHSSRRQRRPHSADNVHFKVPVACQLSWLKHLRGEASAPQLGGEAPRPSSRQEVPLASPART